MSVRTKRLLVVTDIVALVKVVGHSAISCRSESSKDMGGSQRVLLKKMTHHQTSHPRTWGPCWVNNKLTNKFDKKLILDYPLGILDYPHWVDQSEAASHTIRHVLSLPLFLFPFALDHWTRGWVMSHYHVENLPCLSLVVLDATLADQATYPIPNDKARGEFRKNGIFWEFFPKGGLTLPP